jgi:hypothetical protein
MCGIPGSEKNDVIVTNRVIAISGGWGGNIRDTAGSCRFQPQPEQHAVAANQRPHDNSSRSRPQTSIE